MAKSKPEKGETKRHESKETRAFEKSEKEDKKLHKVVNRMAKRVAGMKKK